ncbi:glycosyltransferase family 2 protein [Cellulomonas sp. CW35]|uniref:glycosyltransferase family 2 protein n=1 Tax=unclassified Cellulomonas TaxID=2620175 RepID=UPI000B8D6167|nr:glycosyltransferase family 2 protein [Cellulomonas sp. PSBB021]ASR55046.1 glycosyl transferase family 2 [Cellulomonas sp. PSBB021]
MSPAKSPSEPDGTSHLPPVSVFLTVRDEERHLTAAIERVLGQDYAGELEVVLAVGPSHDRTLEIAHELAGRDARVRVIDNPTGRTPDGLNLAVAAARHDVLVRVDGHSELEPDYVRRAVDALLETGAANVGGRMVPLGTTSFEDAVARAMSSPLGIGSAAFHTGGEPGPAPTVYLGVFRRDALERVGGYDEHFVRAQDWELNHRLREAGEVVWFVPDLGVTYRPRGDVRALARQFFRTGQWRRQVIKRHPQTAGLRYLAPPAAVAGIALGTAVAAVGATAGPRWLLVGLSAPVGYAAAVVAGCAVVGRDLPPAARRRLPGVVATMHLAWGSGFLRGLPRAGAPAVAPGTTASASAAGATTGVVYPVAANAPRPAPTEGPGPDRHVTED